MAINPIKNAISQGLDRIQCIPPGPGLRESGWETLWHSDSSGRLLGVLDESGPLVHTIWNLTHACEVGVIRIPSCKGENLGTERPSS